MPPSRSGPPFNRVTIISLNFPSESIKNEKVNYSLVFNCREGGGEVGNSQVKGGKR